MYLLESNKQKEGAISCEGRCGGDCGDDEILPKASHNVLISLATSAGKGGAWS